MKKKDHVLVVEDTATGKQIKYDFAELSLKAKVGDASVNEDKTVSVKVSANVSITKLKFIPPPDGCEMCWKQRFAEYRKLIDQFGLKEDSELTIEISGECTKQKLERFHNWLTKYLHTFYSDSIKLIYIDHTGAPIS